MLHPEQSYTPGYLAIASMNMLRAIFAQRTSRANRSPFDPVTFFGLWRWVEQVRPLQRQCRDLPAAAFWALQRQRLPLRGSDQVYQMLQERVLVRFLIEKIEGDQYVWILDLDGCAEGFDARWDTVREVLSHDEHRRAQIRALGEHLRRIREVTGSCLRGESMAFAGLLDVVP